MTWRDSAACLNSPVDFFNDDQQAEALAICKRCDVRSECLQWAKDEQIDIGVAGGKTAEERRGKRKPGRPVGSGLKPIDHGTNAGYKAHIRRGDPACEACKDANARYQYDRQARQREWKAARRAEQQADKHGTDADYQRHIMEKSTPCEPCRKARREAMRAYRERKKARATIHAERAYSWRKTG